jgi:hypothetical protein
LTNNTSDKHDIKKEGLEKRRSRRRRKAGKKEKRGGKGKLAAT